VRAEEVVSVVGGCDQGGGEEPTGYRFKENVECRIYYGADCSGVGRKVGDFEGGDSEERWAVAGLDAISVGSLGLWISGRTRTMPVNKRIGTQVM
jgi:hypothetical protein